MKITFKLITESDNWIITKAKQGFNGKVRIDAKTRFHVADGQNSYSEWLSIDYVNRIRREHGLCRIQDRYIFIKSTAMPKEDINFAKELIADYAKKIIMRAELDDKKFDIEDAKDIECYVQIMVSWCKTLVDIMK